MTDKTVQTVIKPELVIDYERIVWVELTSCILFSDVLLSQGYRRIFLDLGYANFQFMCVLQEKP